MTSLKLSIQIAWVHLVSKPKQTLIAMLGVTFGIGMFIAMVSMMTGLNDLTESLAMTSSPDIRIYHDVTTERKSIAAEINPNGITKVHHQKPKNESLKVRGAVKIAEQIRKHPLVKGASVLLNSQVFYNYGPVQLNGTIAGVDILEEDKLFDLKSKMKE
ncbi:MAG: ABC transporter permease, partial [Cytophagia bacterium]|nr:ABC transporter permease [Cytophagia bacterium]